MHSINSKANELKPPRLALDMYVLAQGVKTGIYRVCSELYPRLAQSKGLDVSLFFRPGFQSDAGLPPIDASEYGAPADHRGHAADILLSPFGVAPEDWLLDPDVLHAHIVYDLIGIKHPEYFSKEAASEVRGIVDSLDDRTVIFAISEFTKNDLLSYRPDLDPAQITVIPLAAGAGFSPCTNVAQRVAMREKYGIPPEVPYMLSLATLEVRKNLESVIRAFVLHLERDPASELRLVLSGMSGWKLDQLNGALDSAAKWRHRIIVTGFVDDEDLSPLYSDALCFVYLSRHEGFGLPPLEAMACGTPVICANNSSLPEVVGDAGVLLHADDIQGVVNAIARIRSSPEFRNALSEAGLRRAKLFSWDRCAELVSGALRAAFVEHCARPVPRVSRQALPGGLVRRYQGADGVSRANFIFYANGSRGLDFARSRASIESVNRQPRWPEWSDILPDSGQARIEGGLRTRGVFKSGSAEEPLVSYVTVVRNNEQTLARTIESVQAQTYSKVEHIVLDGDSTDGTLDVIRQFAERIDYFASEPDKGLYHAINKAIPLARGQLICVLNSDDWLEPRAAEIAALRLKTASEAALLMSGAYARGAQIGVEWQPAFVHPGSYFTCANDCHNAIYATPAAYQASGPYDESYRIAADFKWIMTCMDAGAQLFYTRQVTVNYSLGGTSGDVRGHSAECMRVVAERFPFLSEEEVYGLHNCFFLFSAAVGLEDRVQAKADFVRDLFLRYADEPDFVRALTWASMQKLEFAPPAVTAAPVAQAASPSVKELVKSALRRHPAAYTFAQRVYARARKA